MSDIYDYEIARITKRVEAEGNDVLIQEWLHITPLFQFACRRCSVVETGCLTMIREGIEVAETSKLTEAIRADDRLPSSEEDIRLEHLPVFAEWQRRLDVELGRTVDEVLGDLDFGGDPLCYSDTADIN